MWYKCTENGDPTVVHETPRTETSAESVFIWVTSYLVLDCVWIVTALTMEENIAGWNALWFVSVLRKFVGTQTNRA